MGSERVALMEKKNFGDIQRRRCSFPQAIALEVERIITPFIKSQGFYESRIILDWEKIMGGPLSLQTHPQKISFSKGKRGEGTLVLLVTSAIAPEIMHLSPQIIERINGYFGYKAVQKIILKHATFKKKIYFSKEETSVQSAYQEESVKLLKFLEDIPDQNLKNSLSKLGKALIQQKGVVF